MEGIELPTFGEKENYKYLGILKADTIKQVEMKEKLRKEYLRTNERTSRKRALQQKS